MAPQVWRPDPSVKETLFKEGYRFDFFQAVRLIERLYPQRQSVGRMASPAREAVRFCTRQSFVFPASQIHDIAEPLDEESPPRMTVSFMGLTGPLGVLPKHYTELMMQRLSQKDPVLRDFFDLFNHRLISLFYRAGEKYRFPMMYERAAAQDGEEHDAFTQALFALVGLGTRELRARLDMNRVFVFYTGILRQRPCSASALQAVLHDYFNVPVTISQFIGKWLPLCEEDRSRLGIANNQLGRSVILGAAIWDAEIKFRLCIGPLTYARFCDFLPAGSALPILVHVVRFTVPQHLEFEIELLLKAAEVPACRIGQPEEYGPRLGWSTWLKSQEFSHDVATLAHVA
jgi:type VI secretion system protein ImpH